MGATDSVTDAEWRRLLLLVRRALPPARLDPAARPDQPGDAELLHVPQFSQGLRAAIDRHRIAVVLARDTAGLRDVDRDWLRARNDANVRRAASAAARAHSVVTALAADGIRSVVLKGTPLAVVTTGDLAGRSCGDIDLLVDPERYLEAHRSLLAHGWVLDSGPAADPEHAAFAWTRWIDNHASYVRRQHPEPAGYVEVHWRLGRSMLLDLDFETLWRERDEVDVGGVPLPALGRDHLHLHVLAHALRHNTQRLQWAVDVALLEVGLDAVSSQQVDELARGLQPARTRRVARAVVQRIGLLDGESPGLGALERGLVRVSLDSLRTGSARWPHTAGTLAVTGSPSGLSRAVANAATRALERKRRLLPGPVARSVDRLPASLTASETGSPGS